MNAVLLAPPRRPIRDLPDELISQIAAGEVVERPASVVRELLDNALDAGATEIAVRLIGGGVRTIVVEDDGHGIPADELPMALRRHATSKIGSLGDLESVSTMGFRGEALAAIASVAEVAIASRTEDAVHAQRLDARSGELTPAARGRGTSVEVRELFFSTPARRKFLKTEATELAHCVEAVRRHALVRPDVAFSVWHDGRIVQQWRRGSGDTRRRDVLGEELVSQSREVALDTGVLRVHGLAGTPEAARARADQQYVYVNGRFVRDKLIAHGVRSAYEDVLHGGRQPCYALFIDIAPDRVDVNVHPTKIEVRFRDSREVHQLVRRAVEAALAVPRAGHAGVDASSAHGLAHPAAGTVHGAAFERGDGDAASTLPRDTGPSTRWRREDPASYRVQGTLGLQQAAMLYAREPEPAWQASATAPALGAASMREGPPPDVHAKEEPRGRETANDEWPLGRAIAQIAGVYILAENCAGAGRRRHACRARANRLRAPEGRARQRTDRRAAAADSGRVHRHAP